jgi:hypothetical protein
MIKLMENFGYADIVIKRLKREGLLHIPNRNGINGKLVFIEKIHHILIGEEWS